MYKKKYGKPKIKLNWNVSKKNRKSKDRATAITLEQLSICHYYKSGKNKIKLKIEGHNFVIKIFAKYFEVKRERQIKKLENEDFINSL